MQINVGTVMMMMKKGEYDVSARAKRKKAQIHWSVRGAGSKHWEIEGLMAPVAVDQAKLVIYTFEFKRTSDREHGYVQ